MSIIVRLNFWCNFKSSTLDCSWNSFQNDAILQYLHSLGFSELNQISFAYCAAEWKKWEAEKIGSIRKSVQSKKITHFFSHRKIYILNVFVQQKLISIDILNLIFKKFQTFSERFYILNYDDFFFLICPKITVQFQIYWECLRCMKFSWDILICNSRNKFKLGRTILSLIWPVIIIT